MEKNNEFEKEKLIPISSNHNEEDKLMEPIVNSNTYQYNVPSAAVHHSYEPKVIDVDSNAALPVSCKEITTTQNFTPNENTSGQMYQNYSLKEAEVEHVDNNFNNPPAVRIGGRGNNIDCGEICAQCIGD